MNLFSLNFLIILIASVASATSKKKIDDLVSKSQEGYGVTWRCIFPWQEVIIEGQSCTCMAPLIYWCGESESNETIESEEDYDEG